MNGRYLFILSAIVTVSAVCLVAFIRHLSHSSETTQQKRALYMFSKLYNRPDRKSGMCHTPECTRVADHIKNSIDPAVKPCDDFFKFCCGGWIKKNPIPKSYNDYSTFTKLSKLIEGELSGLLRDSNMSHDQDYQNDALVKARNFYQSCMDEHKIEQLGPRPMQDFIKQIGSWSICNDGSWNKSSWDIHKVLRYLQSTYYPAPAFFSVEVTNDHLNSTKHLIKVGSSRLE